ncbi:MAG: hypothetical protein K2Q18_13695 [Bdellovibrionales bacterium]|nr:hypothetical protein [Bdellovibrionales bacterium]
MGALKKPTCQEAPKASAKPKPKLTDANDNSIQKAEIDRMKQLLAEKIKDKDLARKAAMIISEMLDKK